ncbi:hypothetical protein GCM10012275_29200 [Longimycelium tulufanense]|uniref:Uncharacterized protein n=1 Tax=Longimycelium tulufanense TaxID=907463 RepID=A0A8J3CEV1_9PSEU|nr:hypothetical protein GCM10012275_29200 [Longimycelium tulufanense]
MHDAPPGGIPTRGHPYLNTNTGQAYCLGRVGTRKHIPTMCARLRPEGKFPDFAARREME